MSGEEKVGVSGPRRAGAEAGVGPCPRAMSGHAVVLYDTFGSNIFWDDSGEPESVYPAVCTVRNIGGTPVSEWTFCTDYHSQVCSGVDAEGNLLDDSGNPIPGMEPRPNGNPRISDADQRVIAHLIDTGFDYSGTGQWAWGGETRAEANGSVNSRLALQTLIWCVSDPVAADATDEAEVDRRATCETSLPASRLAELRASAPEPLVLGLEAAASTVDVGDDGVFTLTSNVFYSPIEITVSGDAELAVTSGDATLVDGVLTIAGSGTTPVVVELSTTVSAPGTISVSALAIDEFSTVNWNQSPGAANQVKACQVYATWSRVDAAAQLEGVVPTEPTEPTPSEPTEPTPSEPTEPTPRPILPTMPPAPTRPGLPSNGVDNGAAPWTAATVLVVAAGLVTLGARARRRV